MDKTIVITGASSGIGLATALRLAQLRANLVLIARRREPLNEVATQCRELGADVLVLTADMGSSSEVEEAGRQVIDTYGGFDVWINNASVGAYGSFLDVANVQFEKVIQTNIMGYVYGARVALTHYYARRGGMLINVASAFGAFPGPYVSSYVTSKYAVRGLSASLRQELLYEKRSDIQVCTVLPATINTPFYQHAANLSGSEVKAMQPIYPADDVAKVIVGLINRPRSEVVAGGAIRLPKLLYGVAPRLTERLLTRYVAKQSYRPAPSPQTEGNLFVSQNETARISGGWHEPNRRAIKTAFIAGTTIVLAAWLLKRKEK